MGSSQRIQRRTVLKAQGTINEHTVGSASPDPPAPANPAQQTHSSCRPPKPLWVRENQSVRGRLEDQSGSRAILPPPGPCSLTLKQAAGLRVPHLLTACLSVRKDQHSRDAFLKVIQQQSPAPSLVGRQVHRQMPSQAPAQRQEVILSSTQPAGAAASVPSRSAHPTDPHTEPASSSPPPWDSALSPNAAAVPSVLYEELL